MAFILVLIISGASSMTSLNSDATYYPTLEKCMAAGNLAVVNTRGVAHNLGFTCVPTALGDNSVD